MDADGHEKPRSVALVRQSRKMLGETMIAFSRAALFGLGCLATLASAVTPSSAADYPDRPVRWLIGFPAGGPVDTVARIMSQALSEHFGQQFVVENRAGSGGNIATEAGDQRDAGRLHADVQRRQQRNLGLALQETAVRFHPRHRAGRALHAGAQSAGGVERHAGQDRSGVDRLLQAKSRQDCPMPRRATAPRCTCRRNCSRR